MAKSKIEWTERTWNPVTGCTKVSEACRNCYAEVMTRRLAEMPGSKDKYRYGFKPMAHPEALDEPYRWTKPHKVFVCSMGDLFHEHIPYSFILKVLWVMIKTPQHTYQILTKRADRMHVFFNIFPVPDNVWLGVTCESADHYDRIKQLQTIRSQATKFISCEPLLGDMPDIPLEGIHWVITGGESGVSARRTDVEWFRTLRDRCTAQGVAFFFKQWGTWGPDGVKRSKVANGSVLDGREWKEYPQKAE